MPLSFQSSLLQQQCSHPLALTSSAPLAPGTPTTFDPLRRTHTAAVTGFRVGRSLPGRSLWSCPFASVLKPPSPVVFGFSDPLQGAHVVIQSKEAQKQKAKAAVADLKNKLKKGGGATSSPGSSTAPATGGSSAGTTPSGSPASAASRNVDVVSGGDGAGSLSFATLDESGGAGAVAMVTDGSYVTIQPQVDSSYLTVEPQADVTDARVAPGMRMESVDLNATLDSNAGDVSGELHDDVDLDGDISGGGGGGGGGGDQIQEIDLGLQEIDLS